MILKLVIPIFQKEKEMKKLFTILIVSILAISVVFAQGSSEATSSSKTTIAMTWWGDTLRNEVYEKVIDEFEKANPAITVNRPYSTWNNYFDKLSTQMAGGVAPDLIGMHQRYASEYASRGALLDLTPYVESGVLDLSNVHSSIVENGKIDGKLYMLSQGLTGQCLSYYTKAFDDLGVSYPSENWTWDEYKATLEEVRKKADEKGMKNFWPSYDLSYDFYAFSFYVRSKGENLFTEDGKLGFSKESVIEWFSFFKDLRDNGLVPDAATTVEYQSLPLEQSLFATNQVAIGFMPISQVRLYQALVDEGEYKLVRIPHVEGGRNPEYISGAYFCVNSNSKNPKEAVMLLNFFINDPTAQSIFRQEQGLPISTKAVEMLVATASDAEKESIRFIQEDLVPNASPEPYPPAGYNEVNSNYVNTATTIMFGNKTVEDAVNSFFAACESIL